MSLSFTTEPLEPFYTEATPLLTRHWEEIAKNKNLMYLNVDLGGYLAIEKLNQLVVVTARDGGTLVGYFLWAILPHPHHKHVLVAEEDLHYLAPECRKGLNGYLLIKAALRFAKEAGASVAMVREKVGHEHPAIMTRLGLAATDIAYTKTL